MKDMDVDSQLAGRKGVLAATDTPPQDIVEPPASIAHKREWTHGEGGLGQYCPKREEPQRVDPGCAPAPCDAAAPNGVVCGNDEWYAGDHVWIDDQGNTRRRVKEK